MEKKLFLNLLVLSLMTTAKAQEPALENAFDFWLGSWDAVWYDANNNPVRGSNVVEREKGSNVIVEHFEDPSSGFIGTSISVFSSADSTWHQAWADNAGGFINMTGGMDGTVRFFRTGPFQLNGKTVTKRMIFYDITPDSFTWDWEVSSDSGTTWSLLWRIYYTRKK